MFCVFIGVLWLKMIHLLSNKITPQFQLLPMSKVDQSLFRNHEVPPLQYPKVLLYQFSLLQQKFSLMPNCFRTNSETLIVKRVDCIHNF